MIRMTTALIILGLSSTLAFAGTAQTQAAPGMQARTLLAVNMQSDPMNANARMKEKRKKGMMKKDDMSMDRNGMNSGMSGGLKKDGMK